VRGKDESPKREDRRIQRPFAGLEKLRKQMQAAAKPALGRSTPAKPAAPKPPPASHKPKTDEDLFLEEVAGTAPIEPRGGRVGSPPPDPNRRVRRPSDDAEVLAELADLCGGDGPFDIADSDEYIEGIAEGIDRRLLRRLRAGDYAIQAHLDLHGLSRDEARDKVGRFLLDSRRAGRRCVLIVHGRGLHSKDQIPVLKQAVRSWLERGQLARSVLAFATARPTDGGAGAMYVLLRR
jgi:DNA-nicking Smr family endonuclease